MARLHHRDKVTRKLTNRAAGRDVVIAAFSTSPGLRYGIRTFFPRRLREKPIAIALRRSHPRRMVFGPGGL